MTRAHSTHDMTYNPPPLPEYLSRTHDIKIIVGVPTDEEVKAIHDTIRAVNSVANIPALYDHKLSTQLAQYLFTVQMAVYRNEYPSSIFPVEHTYTPPPIPSHIPISLEPVAGAPSDEELESAHGVVRVMENLVNSPFYDSALSVKLSQHLFNIQFARYIQDSNQGHFTQSPANPPRRENQDESPVVNLGHAPNVADQQGPQDVGPIELGSGVPSLSQAEPPIHSVSEPAAITSDENSDKLCIVQELKEANQTLKAISRNLFSTYSHSSTTPTFINGIGYTSYKTINHEGELPWMRCLPGISTLDSVNISGALTLQELASYIKFYNISADLIEEGTGNLKSDKEADAKKRLAFYLYYRRPSHSLDWVGP
ncbi:hypothetical protein B0J17DRAFT_667777 [Rhizoctonia solani]|nr:hypothetical protein B0J17DRAFT_667777 [Rhizoctonia solani]